MQANEKSEIYLPRVKSKAEMLAKNKNVIQIIQEFNNKTMDSGKSSAGEDTVQEEQKQVQRSYR